MSYAPKPISSISRETTLFASASSPEMKIARRSSTGAPLLPFAFRCSNQID